MRKPVLLAGVVFALLIAAAFWATGSVEAENLALVIGNESYDNTTNASEADQVLGLTEALSAAGYNVTTAKDAKQADLREILAKFSDRAKDADRLIVIFAGHVLSDGRDTYLTPTDLKDPRPVTLPLQAPALSAFLAIAGQHAGGAAIFLGFHKDKGGFFGGGAGFRDIDGLTPGLGPVAIPQGVLLVSGPPDSLADALESEFLTVGRPTADAVADLGDDLTAAGYISRFSTLAPGGTGAQVTTTTKAPEPAGDADQRQAAYWNIAEQQNTIAGYKDFLSRYPDGPYSESARTRLKNLEGAPEVNPAQQAEIDLKLSRDDRRQIQRDLTILDHDPHGVDGLFGPATRRAIGGWQAANKIDETGYLDHDQLALLHEQAQTRSDQLAEEAKKKAEDERQADIKFWNQTGRSGQEADLRVYLRNYPDGVYAEEARTQLDAIERDRVNQSQGPERDAWQQAEDRNTIDSYDEYLRQYPDGLFADTARERIQTLQQQDSERSRLEAAQREEQRLGLSTQSWQLIERKLAGLGYDPGRVDGRPTDQTRRAIRKYQSSAGLPVTGYMDRNTLSRLILTIKF